MIKKNIGYQKWTPWNPSGRTSLSTCSANIKRILVKTNGTSVAGSPICDNHGNKKVAKKVSVAVAPARQVVSTSASQSFEAPVSNAVTVADLRTHHQEDAPPARSQSMEPVLLSVTTV